MKVVKKFVSLAAASACLAISFFILIPYMDTLDKKVAFDVFVGIVLILVQILVPSFIIYFGIAKDLDK
jgi:multidrug transporter EmrE-like cation transporter